MGFICSPCDMHPEKIGGEWYFPAREVAELVKVSWGRLNGMIHPTEKKKVYRRRARSCGFTETMITEAAARHLVALYWDRPSAEWRAYVAGLQ